uniref:CDC42 small effector 2 n=1 Tax=Kryptolebias marmoratus TaxID=37003 RepID=A0A3Q3B7K9_KRYMA
MTEFWVCFSCCIAEQPQPKRRRRIDRSMIGEPTNFVHTTHVGFLQLLVRIFRHRNVDLVQAQMKSKGGYSHGGSEGSQL